MGDELRQCPTRQVCDGNAWGKCGRIQRDNLVVGLLSVVEELCTAVQRRVFRVQISSVDKSVTSAGEFVHISRREDLVWALIDGCYS